MNLELNHQSIRVKKARMAIMFSRYPWLDFNLAAGLFSLAGLLILFESHQPRAGWFCLAVGLVFLITELWYKRDLSKLQPAIPAKSLEDILEPHLLAILTSNKTITPKNAWQAAVKTWAGKFACLHLLIDAGQVETLLSNNQSEMSRVWHLAIDMMAKSKERDLDGAALVYALLTTFPQINEYLKECNLKTTDVEQVYGWFSRLEGFLGQPKPYFGGIGRDWASGFTPTLDRFAINISRLIEAGGHHFHTLAHGEVLSSVIHGLGQGSGSVAVIGETGSGKTSLAYALAERLLRGRDQNLRYYQLVSLDASAILSSQADHLEKIMGNLIAESVHAGNIILFLDEAKLFFGTGPGAFNTSQILLPLLQSHNVKLVAAFTPAEFQQLKNTDQSLAAQFSPVIINQPDEELCLKILEDSALTIEARDKVIVTLQAVQASYRLSGQYMPEDAYPGKAISLLEQATAYTEGKFLTDHSVEQAVEKTRGIKVSKADAPEADKLIHLEDSIHRRMINQDRAVKVVSAALRRGRSGVASPDRPVGSFLFLGPTGVGKTELARSLAAVYFGSEDQMIRLDMSEYQNPSDVERLLEAGNSNDKSLIMAIREQPFSVVLLDEVEKAHPNVLNLLLQMLDEGQLTDQNGKPASFKNSIIITTSNAGSAEIIHRIAAGDQLESFERPLIEQLISQQQFKPELINRFDEIVLFRPLNEEELTQVASLMLEEVNENLSNQNVRVELTPAALTEIVKKGYDPEFGARPMRRVIQRMVEDVVAERLLKKEASAGSVIKLDVNDLG